MSEIKLTEDMRAWIDKGVANRTVTTAQLLINFLHAFSLQPNQIGELLAEYLKDHK